MNRAQFSALVSGLALALPPRKPLEPAALEVYWLGLSDLPDDALMAAVGRAARDSTFMPAPSELRGFARPRRDLAHETAIAWDAVRSSVDAIDYTARSVDFGPHVNAVVRQLGGWDALCQATVTDLDVWKRKEFERLYAVFAEKEIGDVGRALEGGAEGRAHRNHTVAIAGIPSQPLKQLPERGADTRSIRDLVGALAEGKAVK